MTNYVGVLDGGGKIWGVRIPDLAGCYGGGATAEAAIEDAKSAAREWMAQQLSKGLAQPKARNLAAIIKAGEFDAGNDETAVMISVILDAGRTVRANLTFDAGLLEAIDEAAQNRGLTRSAFLASAARERLGLR
jgi:predicted RNase H-like HicB family nuclease